MGEPRSARRIKGKRSTRRCGHVSFWRTFSPPSGCGSSASDNNRKAYPCGRISPSINVKSKSPTSPGCGANFLGQLSPAGLLETVVYKNSKGEPWTSTVEDILTHVVLHSAYHRGQIASLMRAGGEQPAYTDFIHAVRQGLIE